MRVQVMRSTQGGFCQGETCPSAGRYVIVNQMSVYLGTAVETSKWLCGWCYKRFEDQGPSFDLNEPVIDKRAPPDRRTKRTSRKRELEVAELVGGRRQPGSGNQPFSKGDVRKKGEFRLELKECFGLEFKVHRVDLLDKIRSECSRGEKPAVVVTFRDKGTHQELESWAMIPFEVWEEKFNAPGTNR